MTEKSIFLQLTETKTTLQLAVFFTRLGHGWPLIEAVHNELLIALIARHFGQIDALQWKAISIQKGVYKKRHLRPSPCLQHRGRRVRDCGREWL